MNFELFFLFFTESVISHGNTAKQVLRGLALKPADADFPREIFFKKDLLEEKLEEGLAAAILLLFYLSPGTGEPVAFHANNRLTQIRSLTASSVVTNVDSSKSFEINFVDCLLEDLVNPVGTSGSNPMHYFATAVTNKVSFPDSDDELKQQKDSLLQTWSSINYIDRSGNQSVPKQLVIANQGVRDVTVRDINELHYILNIPQLHQDTVALDDIRNEEETPVVFFNLIFKKLSSLPLDNATHLYDFISGEEGLGIPLFHQNRFLLTKTPEGEINSQKIIPPIYQQWTLLSYFLQMCSPICLSPIEGGHRTLQLIKFFTGAKFTSRSPQPLEPLVRKEGDRELKPNMYIHQQGVAMTKFALSFWQRYKKLQPMGSAEVKNLQSISFTIRSMQQIVAKDTNDGFLLHALGKIKAAFDDANLPHFTSNDMFDNPVAGMATFDLRITVAFPAILKAIKSYSPFRERWRDVPDDVKVQYENGKDSLVPVFKNLKSALVSFP